MALIGLREAARRTGLHKATIHCAMKSGKLPFTLSANGTRQIDTAHLARVFALSQILARVRRLPPDKLSALAKLLDDLEQDRAPHAAAAFHSRSFQ
jgi:hypothetical protein